MILGAQVVFDQSHDLMFHGDQFIVDLHELVAVCAVGSQVLGRVGQIDPLALEVEIGGHRAVDEPSPVGRSMLCQIEIAVDFAAGDMYLHGSGALPVERVIGDVAQSVISD